MKSTIMRNLLFQHFQGRATHLQTRLLKDWLEQAEHQEQYYLWLQEWEQKNPQMMADPDTAFLHFQQQLTQRPAKTELPTRFGKPRSIFRGFMLAASVTIILFSSAYLTRETWNSKVIENNTDHVLSIVLPDQSRIGLSKNSRVAFPRFGFMIGDRRVSLRGEATFSISHLPDNRLFTIETVDQMQIDVLGTEFKVITNQNITDVHLRSGKIRLDYLQSDRRQQMVMLPGERYVYRHRSHNLARTVQNDGIVQTEKEWILTDISLRQLSRKIEETYHVKVQIQRKQDREVIVNGIVPTENMDMLLRCLSQTLNRKIFCQNRIVQIQ